MRHARSRSYFTLIGALILFVSYGCSQARSTSKTEGPTDDQIPIGYGTISVDNTTGSVVALTEKDRRNSTAIHLQQLIQGQVAGVHVIPTSAGRFRVVIRGGAPGSAPGDPLYVIDGIPVPRGPDVGIDPSTVQRIVILKDAAAAVYGWRGANGVVLIETKGHH